MKTSRSAVARITLGVAIVVGLGACVLATDGTAPDTTSSSGAGGETTGPGTGGATSSGSMVTTGTTGGSKGYEDCLDGIDNNDDGLIDCQDPACQPGYECVPEAPADMDLARFALRSFPSDPLPCDDGNGAQSVMNDPGGPATCTSCSCAAAQNLGCAAPVLSCYKDTTSCGGSVDFTSNQDDNNCHNFPGSLFGALDDSCIRSVPSQPKGDCPASGGVPSLPPAWNTQRDLCRLTEQGGGCANGQVCVTKAVGDFDARICAVREGETGCPSQWSPVAVGYLSTLDDRGCDACTCSAPQGLSCTPGDVDVYDSDNCNDFDQTIGANCSETSGAIDLLSGSYRLNPGQVSGQGTCTAGGGQPSGSVTGEKPVTICCRGGS